MTFTNTISVTQSTALLQAERGEPREQLPRLLAGAIETDAGQDVVSMKLRTCAVFHSDAFNMESPKEGFAHPENFGDDLARWLMEQLLERGVDVDDAGPEQEDHGWYITFRHDGQLYDLVVSFVPSRGGGTPSWLVCLERSHGLLGSLFGQRRSSIKREPLLLMHEVLSSSDLCGSVTWLYFKDVRRGRLTTGATHPLT